MADHNYGSGGVDYLPSGMLPRVGREETLSTGRPVIGPRPSISEINKRLHGIIIPSTLLHEAVRRPRGSVSEGLSHFVFIGRPVLRTFIARSDRNRIYSYALAYKG